MVYKNPKYDVTVRQFPVDDQPIRSSNKSSVISSENKVASEVVVTTVPKGLVGRPLPLRTNALQAISPQLLAEQITTFALEHDVRFTQTLPYCESHGFVAYVIWQPRRDDA